MKKNLVVAASVIVAWGLAPLFARADEIPEKYRETAIAAHAISHRMLRIFEAARARAGEEAVDALLTEWGRLFFVERAPRDLLRRDGQAIS